VYVIKRFYGSICHIPFPLTLLYHFVQVRDLLRGHQSALKAGVEALRSLEVRKQTEQEGEEQRQLASLQEWGGPSPIPDWTCPMCGQYLPSSSVDFNTFQKHVMDHFAPDHEDDIVHAFDFCE
jgi:DNA repair exonuclease SbcCD ATPase subunit